MKPWVKIVIGLLSGVVCGVIFGHKIAFLDMVGASFINLLKMLAGVVVFSSLSVGICHISDPKKLGRIGKLTLLFYFSSTLVAILMALTCAYIFTPGAGLQLHPQHTIIRGGMYVGVKEFIMSMVPSNPFYAFYEGNIIQIIVFALLFSCATMLAGKKAKPIVGVLESINETMYSLTHLIMKLTPYGVFALMASTVNSIGIKIIYPLIKFLLCNYLVCFIQIFVVFSLSLKYLAKVGISPFFKGMKDAIVLAFTTSSSSATLPVSLECARDHLGISSDISGFVLSIGSTVNMNGAAVGQAVSALFIAQAYGIELTAIQLVCVAALAFISAIGAAGIPGTGIIMLSILLTAVGLPIEGIAILTAVDRLREMVSSVVNILGDAVAAVFVAKSERQIDEARYYAVTWTE